MLASARRSPQSDQIRHAFTERASPSQSKTRRSSLYQASYQGFSVCLWWQFSGRLPCYATSPLSSLSASFQTQGLWFGALPCQPTWFSMKDTFLPFTVHLRWLTLDGASLSKCSSKLIVRPVLISLYINNVEFDLELRPIGRGVLIRSRVNAAGYCCQQ